VNAITLLENQHREVEELFTRLEEATKDPARLQIFNTLADKLAIHCTIEEKIFYPAVKARQTEELLGEAVQEHLQAKRLLVDIMNLDAGSDEFEAKCKVLMEEIEHHVEEEEGELFPKCKDLMDGVLLEALGQEMTSMMTELEEKSAPREAIFDEVKEAAPI